MENFFEKLENKLPWWIPRVRIYIDGEAVVYTAALLGFVTAVLLLL